MMHARFSASSSSRWLSCTASMLQPERKKTESPFSKLGVALHAYSDDLLKGNTPRLEYDGVVPSNADIEELVLPYVDYIKNLKATYYFYEKKVKVCKDVWGTADCIAYCKEDDCLHICDFKAGRGIYVEVEQNLQLQIYAIGAINYFREEYNFTPSKIVLHIIQPALDNLKSWEVPYDQLKDLRKQIFETIDKINKKEVEFKPSESACRWCNSKPFCPELKKIANKAALEDFENIELSDALKIVPLLKTYIKAVEETSLTKMRQGGNIDGFKLVNGRGARNFFDEKAVIKFLLENKFEEDELFNKKMLTVAQIEKVIKKNKYEIDITRFINKTVGATKIVEQSDKRKGIDVLKTAGNSALEDFKDI